jgi:hypothetical protein
MTGTRRAFRGRGPAAPARTASLSRARAAGHRRAGTGDEAGNAPMLAVTTRLGHRVAATERRTLPGA